MSSVVLVPEGRKEACKTYLEQTKLLVTLASAFLVAPAAFVGIMKDRTQAEMKYAHVGWLVVAELFFIGSVLAGYVALAALAGSQDRDEFNVYRRAVRYASIIQLLAYLFGLSAFIGIVVDLVT